MSGERVVGVLTFQAVRRSIHGICAAHKYEQVVLIGRCPHERAFVTPSIRRGLCTMLFQSLRSLSLAALGVASLFQPVVGSSNHDHTKYDHPAGHWVAAWASMPQLTEPANLPNPPFNTSGLVFANTTLRQTIHVTAPSSRIRLRISNAFGTTSLPITAATIARPANGTPGSSAIDTSTVKTLTFSGSPSFTIPNGALVVSDPIDFDVKAQTELSISLYLASGQVGNDITSHPGSRTTSFMTFGNQLSAANLTGQVQSVAHWYENVLKRLLHL